MDPNTFPTKGNLIAAKNSLKLATMGYGLMDKKRNILIRELMGLIDEARGYSLRSTLCLRLLMKHCRAPILSWASIMSRRSECPFLWTIR